MLRAQMTLLKYFIKNSKMLLISLCIIFLSADNLMVNSEGAALFAYMVLVILAFYFVDFKLPSYIYICLFLFISVYLIYLILGVGELVIFLKYSLILFVILISFAPQSLLRENTFYLITVPWFTLIFIGCFQAVFMFTNPSFILQYLLGHGRPIGLSVEPTFYSQQLLVLWMLYAILEKNKKSYHWLLEIFTVALIVLCATRTSMLLAIPVIFFRLRQSKGGVVFSIVSITFLILTFREQLQTIDISLFTNKLQNLFNMEGEPRQFAFFGMLEAIKVSPFFGSGFSEEDTQLGIAVGSLYANIFLAHFYSFGILSVPFIGLLIYRLLLQKHFNNKFLILALLSLSMIMPFLYTPFGLISWLIVANLSDSRRLVYASRS